jgi:hypothetical protein
MPSSGAARNIPERPGDQDTQDDQPDHNPAGVPLELPEIEAQTGVIEDDRHRQ